MGTSRIDFENQNGKIHFFNRGSVHGVALSGNGH